MKLISILLALLISGCFATTIELTNNEKLVRVLRKSEPPATCKEIGKVEAFGYAAITDEAKESILKRETYAKGGNVVTVDKVDADNTLMGTAYRCN